MRLFVTGSTGFIGSHFLRAALAAGHDIVALRFPGTKEVVPLPEGGRIAWVDGDLNAFFADSTISPPTSSVFVHLAAAGVNPKHATWEVCFETNLNQSLALWRRAAAAGVRNFVLCGSCFEYGLSAEQYEFIPPMAPLLPTGAYHASKAAATMAGIALSVEQELNLSILRPFHVYGEGEGPDRFWPALRKAALAGEDFPMTLGEQIRDFIPVEDVVSQFLQETERMVNPERNQEPRIRIANVGTGRPQTLREFAEYWWKHWNAKGKLLLGSVPYRDNEVMRYVPEVTDSIPIKP